MKNVFFTLILLLTSTFIFSQEFTYKKVISTNNLGTNIVYMNGSVNIEDSFITITTEGVVSKMEVIKQQDYENSKVYRVIQPEGSDYEIRISFTINELVKKDKYLLSYEMKDHFRNEISTLAYYLIPTK